MKLKTMLREFEKAEFKRILEKVCDDEVFSLCETVTNKLVTVVNRKEAIQAILSYSESAEQLLKRKKLKRNYLFQYLADSKVVVPASAEKQALVQHVLHFWATKFEGATAESPPSTLANICTDNKAAVKTLPSTMAGEFTHWFYNMLNSYNVMFGAKPTEEFGVQHFYEGCVFELVTMVHTTSREEFKGAEIVVRRLLHFVQEEGLLFGASECREEKSAHGLIVIMVAGTIHCKLQFMGIFEQSFGIVRSPVTNRFVIKFTNMKIKSNPETENSIEGVPTDGQQIVSLR